MMLIIMMMMMIPIMLMMMMMNLMMMNIMVTIIMMSRVNDDEMAHLNEETHDLVSVESHQGEFSYIGRILSHKAPIVGIAFGQIDGRETLVSVGEDKYVTIMLMMVVLIMLIL